ncbi:hypothetical protein BDP55DRAFT_733641 [Colletotrichum godetiae]|uniref:Uncharacterized protein n=1 Tax=Colletotrichum godetiae TaxID=1209918 RepID=A0AAJ0ACA0_9PEZI|nr:uncharacterized protein BDP55DRAFT_733641 [Colletotrichum godetiae]KAK1658976.1 hypothetical protein BDP55DRAFT_733641 [Colletotrichum godetiae]
MRWGIFKSIFKALLQSAWTIKMIWEGQAVIPSRGEMQADDTDDRLTNNNHVYDTAKYADIAANFVRCRGVWNNQLRWRRGRGVSCFANEKRVCMRLPTSYVDGFLYQHDLSIHNNSDINFEAVRIDSPENQLYDIGTKSATSWVEEFCKDTNKKRSDGKWFDAAVDGKLVKTKGIKVFETGSEDTVSSYKFTIHVVKPNNNADGSLWGAILMDAVQLWPPLSNG